MSGPADIGGGIIKAIRYERYGPPEVLELRDVGMPAAGGEEMLVRVRAASVNPLDWHFMRGSPYLVRVVAGVSRPKAGVGRLGADMAGSVEAVGTNVTGFQPGDEAFGSLEERGTLAEYRGTLAEYISIRHNGVVLAKPVRLAFGQAAAVPVAGFTALQGLRDKGRIQPGHRVLVNGASGGVGTFAVQIAKAFGAKVTGVCSTANLEMVAAIGADQVIDYIAEDFTQARGGCDLMIDIAGNRTMAETRRVLAPNGVLVAVGGLDKGRWIGPLGRSARMAVLSPAASQRMVGFLAHQNKADLAALRELVGAGKVEPVIDRTYRLTETAKAIGDLEQGHARGKVVITI